MMKNNSNIILIFGFLLILFGIFFLFRPVDEFIINIISKSVAYFIKPYWAERLQAIGFFLIFIGTLFILILSYIKKNLEKTKSILIRYSKFIKIIRLKIGKYFFLGKDEQDLDKKNYRNINYCDLGIIIFFLLVSLLFFYDPCLGNNRFVELGGDAATYTSGVAALDHPELFNGDPLYGNFNNFEIYTGIHIPLIRFLTLLTKSYGFSFLLLMIPHVFFHLLGFYILGRLILKNRFWALFLAIIAFIPISLDQERWGVWLPLPRFLFQSFLPFLLCLAFQWKDKPGKWPWLMIISGLSIYIHSFSGLIWGFCIWLGFIPFLPLNWPKVKKAYILMGLGLLFMLIITPYVLSFLPGHQHGSSPDYEFVIYILKNFFPNNIFNVIEVLKGFINISLMNGILILAFISMVVLFFVVEDRKGNFLLILIWSIGILLVSILIPFLERNIEKILRVLPIEVVLTRGLRFIYPLLLLLIVWALKELHSRIKKRELSSIMIVFGLIYLCLYSYSQRSILLYEWQKIDPFISNPDSECIAIENKARAMQSIKELTPPGSKFLTYTWKGIETAEFYEIRYEALRPLVFNYKDSGQFVYRDYGELKEWYQIYWDLKKIAEKYQLPCERLTGLLGLQKELQADYLFVDSNGNDLGKCQTGSRIVFNIDNYYLMQ